MGMNSLDAQIVRASADLSVGCFCRGSCSDIGNGVWGTGRPVRCPVRRNHSKAPSRSVPRRYAARLMAPRPPSRASQSYQLPVFWPSMVSLKLPWLPHLSSPRLERRVLGSPFSCLAVASVRAFQSNVISAPLRLSPMGCNSLRPSAITGAERRLPFFAVAGFSLCPVQLRRFPHPPSTA